MNISYLFHRLTGLLIIIPLALMTRREDFANIFILFGQGHFLMGYLYSWKKGHFSRGKMIYLVCLALAVVPITHYLLNLSQLQALAAVIFFIHFILDEQYLSGKGQSWLNLLFIPLFVIGLAPFLARHINALHYLVYLPEYKKLLVILWGLMTVGFITSLKINFDMRSVYYYILSSISPILMMTGWEVHIHHFLGSFILYHYVNWYLDSWGRMGPSTKKRYILEVVLINLAFTVLFVMYKRFDFTPAGVLFGSKMFYVWTIIHILFTVRLDDYRNLFRLPLSTK